MITEKVDTIKILSITCAPDGSVYGLGDDQNVYIWHHSQEHAGSWVYYVTD